MPKKAHKLTLRTLLVNLFILLHASRTCVPRNLPIARGTLIGLVRIARTHASRDRFRSCRFTFSADEHEVVVAEKIAISS